MCSETSLLWTSSGTWGGGGEGGSVTIEVSLFWVGDFYTLLFVRKYYAETLGSVLTEEVFP